MNTQAVSAPTFRGYDARRLKGFLMTANPNKLADEMAEIGKKEGFKIFSCGDYSSKGICRLGAPKNEYNFPWTQDIFTMIGGKLLQQESECVDWTEGVKSFFGLKSDKVYTQELERYKLFKGWQGHKVAKVKVDSYMPDISKIYEQRQIFREYKRYVAKKQKHIPGGNIFIVKGSRGNELLVGSNNVQSPNNPNSSYPKDTIQEIYNAKEITVLPQMDYHLDLFIRPLDKKRILIVDDTMTLSILNKGLEKFKAFLQQIPESEVSKYSKAYDQLEFQINKFTYNTHKNMLPNTDEVENILQKSGYTVIRVPGRIYKVKNDYNAFGEEEQCLIHDCNYLNANVLLNSKKDLVYISADTGIDKQLGLTPKISKAIGFSFQDSVKEILSKYIKPEHIYFVKGDSVEGTKNMLTKYEGSIHCMCAEVPFRHNHSKHNLDKTV
jgi:hypothetical protein